jgi:hypothetical protein
MSANTSPQDALMQEGASFRQSHEAIQIARKPKSTVIPAGMPE